MDVLFLDSNKKFLYMLLGAQFNSVYILIFKEIIL